MPKTPGTDDFDFILVGVGEKTSFAGYNSSIDPTDKRPELMVQGSQNVYKKTSGNIANRFGRKRWDTVNDSTIAGCKSGFIWNTSLGAIIPTRVANAKFQFSSSISGTQAWYDLQTGLSLTRYVFDTWWDNTNKKDKLIFVRGDSSTFAWDGGIALFVSAINNTSITLDRDAAAAGFGPSGSVIINGTSYVYTGITGSTLTGVVGDASAQAVNTVSYSNIITNSNTPASGFTNDFIKVVNNQLYSGSYTSRIIYLSKNTDYTSHASSATRLVGEGDTIILDENAKGIGSRLNAAYIFGGTSDVYPVTFSQITVGGVLSEITNRGKVVLGNLVAAQAHEFIDTIGDNIVYMDQSNQVRSYGTFTNFFKDVPALLSVDVQDELAEVSFTGGELKAISDRGRNIIYITSPTTGNVYWYEEMTKLDKLGNLATERIWQPPFVWNISRIDIINGVIVGFSNSNPQIYQLWDTGQYHDDSPSGNLPYNCIMLMAYQSNAGRTKKVVFEKVFYEGYITNGTALYGGIYYDYQGYTGIGSIIINQIGNLLPVFFSGSVPPSLGDASLGDNPLGDGVNTLLDDQNLLPKFKVIKTIQPKDCFEYALMVYSNSADARWEIVCLGTNVRLSEHSAIEISR